MIKDLYPLNRKMVEESIVYHWEIAIQDDCTYDEATYLIIEDYHRLMEQTKSYIEVVYNTLIKLNQSRDNTSMVSRLQKKLDSIESMVRS
ncbi:hypothetical protein [Bacillus stercoris]|uniref:hypothetical protein n=1 Tax=Bacillus stercoris TaxID=2054641 RepID=UPI003F75761C